MEIDPKGIGHGGTHGPRYAKIGIFWCKTLKIDIFRGNYLFVFIFFEEIFYINDLPIPSARISYTDVAH